jgi:hypothetical protein
MSDPSSRTRYRVAQAWRYRNGTPEASDQLVILGVEDHPTQGIICQFHVAYEPMMRPARNSFAKGCGTWVTQSALDRSVIELIAERRDLPSWFGSTGEFRIGPEHWKLFPGPMAEDRTVGEVVREQTEQNRRMWEEDANGPTKQEPPDESLGQWSLIDLETVERFRELLRRDPALADRPLPRDQSDDYCYSGEAYHECYPQMLAAELGSVPIAEVLLEAGADPRRTNARGDTALHFTGRASGHDDGAAVIARMLCERGADPVARNASGETPLAHSWRIDVAKVLMDFGVPPNLNHAIRLRMLDRVRSELRDNHEANRAAPFPSIVLEDIGSIIREEAERRCGREERLLRGKIPADGEDGWRDRLACRNAQANRLADGGTRTDRDRQREAWSRHARFERAAFEEYRELLESALGRGADPNAGSALFYAVQMIDTSLAEWLLSNGADPNRDVKRGIATYLSEIVRMQPMRDLLHRHGAQDNPYKRAPHPWMTPPRPGGPRLDSAGPDRVESERPADPRGCRPAHGSRGRGP